MVLFKRVTLRPQPLMERKYPWAIVNDNLQENHSYATCSKLASAKLGKDAVRNGIEFRFPPITDKPEQRTIPGCTVISHRQGQPS